MRDTMNTIDTRVMITLKTIVSVAALSASIAASAQTAGTWTVKAGYNNIAPKVTSGDLSPPSLPGSKVDVNSASSLIVTAAYMFTDNISAELYLGLPYKHDLIADGVMKGAGKIGSVTQLPPTLFAQYRFMDAKAALRPYVGLGLTYAMFRKEEGSAVLTATTNPGGVPTTLKVDNAWGITPQIGAIYAFNERWFADVGISKTFIKTTNTLSTGQKIDIRLDPVAVNFSIGYRF
jgi:outer membrane protein